ncbi:MAG: hypothetical protein QNJ22_20995 [Desulfosarcinaceae bacterium]|nr:hypothetical protein [Desulfosarcinaceae bacterium]
MTQQPLATLTLDNQLTLNLFDESRQMAADRWRVELVLQIEIPISERWFDDTEPPAQVAELTAALGESVRFEYRDSRTFVDAGEKAALLERLQANLLAMAPQYYGHANFPARYIARRYRQARAEHTGG